MRSGSLCERPTLVLPTVETDGSASPGDETAWRSPQSDPCGVSLESLTNEDGSPWTPGQRAYRIDGRGRRIHTSVDLNQQTNVWQTPASFLGKYRRQVHQTERTEKLLPAQAEDTKWPTPRTITGGAESAERKKELGRIDSGGGDLQAKVQDWPTPTPTSRDWRSGQASPETMDRNSRPLNEAAETTFHSGLPAPQISTPGPEFSPGDRTSPPRWPTPVVTDSLGARNATSTRPEDSKHHSGTTLTDAIQPTVTVTKKTAARLNPRFVEWLMNWPLGWTGFAPVAMGSFLSRQRSRYEFFCRALGLSSEVPTVALRSHPNADVQRILDKTGGKIVRNWLYELPEETMTKGFERLRNMIYWLWGVGAKEDEVRPFKGRPVPQEISEVMLWLRDHYGTDAERKAAMDRYMGLSNAEVIARFAADYQARSQAPSAASTSQDSSSSGSA